MQFITNRIRTGKAKRFEDFIKDYQNKKGKKQVKVASVEEPVKTAEQEEADSSGQLDVEPLHQTGESTTMPKAGPSAKKDDGEKSAGAATKEKDEADSSGQPEAEGKLVNKPKVPTKEEKGGETEEEIKEAKKELPEALKKHQFKATKGKATEDTEESDDKEAEDKEGEEAAVKGEEEEEEEEEGKEKKEGKEAQCKETDDKEEKKDEEDKEGKEASDEPKFVKVANLDAKNKAFLKKYWKQLFGEEYANAMIADK